MPAKYSKGLILARLQKDYMSLILMLLSYIFKITCNLPSNDLGIVTHLLGCPGQLRACSSASIDPFFFFNFFTSESTAFSAHFSSSSPLRVNDINKKYQVNRV